MTDVGSGAGAGAGSGAAAYLLERAWVDGQVRDDVLVEIEDGRFTRVTPAPLVGANPHDTPSPSGVSRGFHRSAGETRRLPGLTLPGLANGHSHAFHRALRGRTQRGRGTFWSWREQMYAVAGRLTPESYFELARAVYREMAASGITTVGEFHYLHHQPDGTPYDDPNEMGHALIAAAREVGLRICLLDTCYLSGGFGRPVEGVQRRYSDRDVDGWVERLAALDPGPGASPNPGPGASPNPGPGASPDGGVRIGGAYHSVRAVPLEQMRRFTTAPLHLHLSEQPAENEECLAHYGLTPAQVVAEAGHLGPGTTLVHATHLTDADIALIGGSSAHVCLTPTTERDLGDGIGPARALQRAGATLTLGSDSHAVVDLFEEMRALELDERLATRERGHWRAAELLAAATRHAALGYADAGAIAVGQRADLVTLDTTSPRTAGTGADECTAVFAATAADVTHVVADGRVIATRDDHAQVGRDLAAAIGRVHDA